MVALNAAYKSLLYFAMIELQYRVKKIFPRNHCVDIILAPHSEQ